MKSKYTGFGLTGIRYDQKNEIELFEIGEFEDGEALLDTFLNISREELIEWQLTDDSPKIHAMYEPEEGYFVDGNKVNIVKGKSGYFIRIDDKQIEEDFIGNLPEFE